jgi:MGT family glycosyltransferase
MARILAYTSPARGHLYPLVPVLDALRDRGHDVAVRTLPSELDALVARGLRAAPLAPAVLGVGHDDYKARTPVGAVRRSLGTFARRAAHEVPDVRAAIDVHRPDLLLVDTNTWGAAAVAEGSGLPWAQWLPFLTPVPSASAPPFGPGLPPARGPLGRLRDRVTRPAIFGGYERALLPEVNRVRASAGLPPAASASDVLLRAPLTLYLTAEPFDYPRADWPSSYRLVGPTSWDPPAEPPAWLADLPDPLVLVSTSTEFQDDGRLVAAALDGLRDAGVSVVATTPSADPGDVEIPPGARVERFLPHAPVLARAACVVCHGGMGITQKALAAGVPVCVVPFGRDQLEVARRVEVAGAGTRLPASRLNARRLRAAVEQAMTMREGARRVAAAYEGAGGAPAAADAVEELLPDQAPDGAVSSRREIPSIVQRP